MNDYWNVDAVHAYSAAWLANSAEIRRLRDAEPTTRCARCASDMARGDRRCHVCANPNPAFVHRGLDPIIWGDPIPAA